MWGKKDNEMAKQSNSAPSGLNSINSLSKGTVVEGTINADSDIRIDGTIKGTVDCKGKLIVGPTGVLEGTITCANAVIEGTIKGNLSVNELLHVKETANINGEIVTDKLIVSAGAIFNVKCQMSGQVLSGFNSSDKKAS